MEVRIKKLVPGAVMPKYAHETDAGLDLTATSFEWDVETMSFIIHSGLAFEIPDGYVGLIFPRSSVYRNRLSMCNCVGVIDSGYRGEVTARFYTQGLESSTYQVGERFAQMIILPYPRISIVEVERLAASDRGTGGYGSTGK